tara:strand:- start:206 stop:553 length:348 start_codon:yes stop_codon:yes gene_type:complete
MISFLNFLRTRVELAIMVVVHLVILALPFIESVRSNFYEMINTLLENGLIGYAVIIVLFSILIPSIKLWYFVVLERGININLLKRALEKTDLEQKLSTYVWVYLPVLLVIYVYFF